MHQTDEHRPSVDYEPRDVRWRSVAAVGAALLALLIGSAWGMWRMQSFLFDATHRALPERKGARAEFPPISKRYLLSADLAQQLQELRDWEQRRLTAYERLEGEEGVVRIPIERAMELVVERQMEKSPEPDGEDGRKQDVMELEQ